MIVQKVTAADIYKVKPDYQRFQQKYNMTRQPFWEPRAAELTKNRNTHLRELLAEGKPGYSQLDSAFYLGACANMIASSFNINWPNRRGNSWYPLSSFPTPDTIGPDFKASGRICLEPSKAAQLLSKVSKFFGVDEVGFCLLDKRWVFSHWFDEETKEQYPIKFSDEAGYERYQEPIQLEDRTQVIPAAMRYVIVLVHEMNEPGVATAPTLTQMATTHTAYSRISYNLSMIAEFIRGLGYHAIPSSNCTALSIPLAIDAGLGELGRNAKLINPKYGPRCRVSKIITDLPVETASPKLWGVTEFCETCGKCARHCPAQAIPSGERSYEPRGNFSNSGALLWQVDHGKCYEYFTKVGTNCGICIRVCPFNKPQGRGHDIARWMVRRKIGAVNSFMTWADDKMGYGRFKKPDDFWKG